MRRWDVLLLIWIENGASMEVVVVVGKGVTPRIKGEFSIFRQFMGSVDRDNQNRLYDQTVFDTTN